VLLPIRTNVRPWRTPYANYVLIATNIGIFMAIAFVTMVLQTLPDAAQRIHAWQHRWIGPLMLVPGYWRIWQFLTYAFLHQGLLHILGNMYFLYLFGNNVNDKLGNLGYTVFYLAGAIFSGLGHAMFNWGSTTPTLGASGAVAAVTGAYLVLFPQTLITVLYWFIFIGTIEVPALYFIALKMIVIDNILVRYHFVAYDAHLSGYAFGIVAVLIMLAIGLIQGSNWDLWAMIRRWNRRRQYRDVVSAGYDPFSGAPPAKPVEARQIDNEEPTHEVLQLRKAISNRIYERNLPDAAELYLQLMMIDPNQVLPRQNLLDIANQLAGDRRSAEAAAAYEQFLKHYGPYEHAEQVRLMLGILYVRYLNEPQKAKPHLQAAAENLSDPGQLKLCTDLLAAVG